MTLHCPQKAVLWFLLCGWHDLAFNYQFCFILPVFPTCTLYCGEVISFHSVCYAFSISFSQQRFIEHLLCAEHCVRYSLVGLWMWLHSFLCLSFFPYPPLNPAKSHSLSWSSSGKSSLIPSVLRVPAVCLQDTLYVFCNSAYCFLLWLLI